MQLLRWLPGLGPAARRGGGAVRAVATASGDGLDLYLEDAADETLVGGVGLLGAREAGRRGEVLAQGCRAIREPVGLVRNDEERARQDSNL